MLQSLSLKIKLILSFSITALLLVAVGVVNEIYTEKSLDHYREIVSISVPNFTSVAKLSSLLQEGQMQIEMFAVELDQKHLETILHEYKTVVTEMDVELKNYESIPFSEGEEQVYTPFKNAWVEWVKVTGPLVEAAQKGDLEKNRTYWEKYLMETVLESHEKVQAAHDRLNGFHVKAAEARAHAGEAASKMGFTVAMLMIAFGFFSSAAIGFFISTWLVKNLSEVGKFIQESSAEVSASSEQLSSASQTMANGSSTAAASLEETVASLEELTSIVKTNSDHAQEASSLSQKSSESAEHGSNEVQGLITAMKDLSHSSKKIEEIIHLIDDIAFQTNLLALNAAVEAARAGEQGKGFAVVAEAVRGLAQRSATAAKDISTLIQSTVEKTNAGAISAEKSGEVLRQIVEQVKRVSDLNTEIATASQEQSKGITQISQAMNDLDRSTQGNAASAEEVAASSEEMNAQARLLVDMSKRLAAITWGSADKQEQVQKPQFKETMTNHTTRSEKSFQTAKPATAAKKVIPKPKSSAQSASNVQPASKAPAPIETAPTTDDDFWNELPKMKRAS